MASSPRENQFAVSAIKLSVKLLISAVLCVGLAVCAQAQDAQRSKTDEPWTATTESSVVNQNPARTAESHTKSGNRDVDKQTVEVLGSDGRDEPRSETEKETVRVNDSTTRTVVRTYTWDINGRWALVTETEEEAHSTAGGEAHVVRTTSNSDVNGNLQVVQREVADTSKAGPDAQETKTTVYQADGSGGFTTSLQMQELQKRRSDHTIEVNETTLAPDGNGNWNVSEVKEKTIKEDGRNRTTEEGVSRADSEGKLSEVSRTVHEETENAAGEKSDTVDSYALDVPGSSRDGSLHLTRRITSLQKKRADGEITEEQVEQPNPANPSSNPQVSTKTKYTVLYGATSTQQTKTTQTSDANGNLSEVSVETRKSDQVTPANAATAPSDKPQ